MFDESRSRLIPQSCSCDFVDRLLRAEPQAKKLWVNERVSNVSHRKLPTLKQ